MKNSMIKNARTRSLADYLKLTAILVILAVCVQLSASYVLNVVLNMLPKVADEYLAIQDTLIRFDFKRIFTVCVFAPVLEETVFRLLILRLGARFIPFWIMNVIQAVLFGIYHGNWVQGIYAFIIGMLFGYIMHVCEWLAASVIVHMAVNTCGYVMQVVPLYQEGTSPAIPVIAIIALLLGGAIIIHLRGQYEQANRHI